MTSWTAPTWLDRLGGIAWRVVAIVAALSLVVSGAVALSSIFVPVLLGLLFACGLQPLAERLRRWHLRPGLAAAVSVLLLNAAIGAVVWLTVTTVVDGWDEITDLVVDGRATLESAATDAGVDAATSASVSDDVSAVVPRIIKPLLEGLVQIVPTVTSIVTSVLLGFLVSFFFLKDGAEMWGWLVSRIGSTGGLADRVGRRSWLAVSGFIRGQAIIAAIDAAAVALGALALGVPEPGAIFMLTFLGAFIPFIGAFLSGLVAVMLALGDSGVDAGLAMLAVVVVVQLIEGNILQPWIQGRAVTLHPLVIALSVTAGGAIAGFLGVLLAVPVTASAFVALSELRAAGVVGSPLASPAGAGTTAAAPGGPPRDEHDAPGRE